MKPAKECAKDAKLDAIFFFVLSGLEWRFLKQFVERGIDKAASS